VATAGSLWLYDRIFKPQERAESRAA